MKKSKKTIAIIANTSWYLFNFRLSIANRLRANGYKVIFISKKDRYTEKLSQKFTFIELKNNGTIYNPYKILLMIYSLYKIIKKNNIDLLLTFTSATNLYASIAANFSKTKIINNVSGLGFIFVKKSLISSLALFLYKLAFYKSDYIFFQNEDDLQLFKKNKILNNNVSNSILPGSGVNINRFSPKINNYSNEKFVFLLASRLLWDKGIGEYVEASKILAKNYKKIEFQLLGPYFKENPNSISKAQIDKWTNDGHINYLGSSDNIEKIISNSDCFVLPSYYREGVPRVLLEAASMEKPIITCDSVGCRKVVNDTKNGYLVEPKNISDLVLKMEKMFRLSSDERKLMGKFGRKMMIKEFDEKIVIEKYLEAITSITCFD